MREVQYRIDSAGREVPEPSVHRWVEWLAVYRREGKHVVARHELDVDGERVIVSSVFTGHDLAFDGPPLLYETMVFGGKLSGMRVRWSSRSMALFGSGLMYGNVETRKHPSIVRHELSLLLVRRDAFAEGPPDNVQRALHGVDREVP